MKVFYLAAWAAYVVATARYALGFLRSWSGPAVWGGGWMAAGAVAHLVATALFTVRFGHPPLVGLAPSLATLALLLALALWILTLLRAAGAVGLLLAPVAATLLGLAHLLGIEAASDAPIYSLVWLPLHVSLSFIGYASLLVAAAASLMYLLQFRQLKQKRFGAVFEFFPDLDTLDRVSAVALLAGFTSLTLGLLVGWAWTLSFETAARWNMPQIVWGVLTWLVFLVALLGRAIRRWMGRTRAWINVVVCAAVVVAYFVLKWNTPGARFFL